MSSRRCARARRASCSRTSDPEDIVRAVRVVAEGESLLSPSVTRRRDRDLRRRRGPRRPGGRRARRAHRARGARSSRSSARGCPTPRSASAWSSARRRRAPTSRGRCSSSARATARSSSSSPTRPGSSRPAAARRSPRPRRYARLRRRGAAGRPTTGAAARRTIVAMSDHDSATTIDHGRLGRLGAFVHRHRGRVVLAWVAGAGRRPGPDAAAARHLPGRLRHQGLGVRARRDRARRSASRGAPATR